MLTLERCISSNILLGIFDVFTRLFRSVRFVRVDVGRGFSGREEGEGDCKDERGDEQRHGGSYASVVSGDIRCDDICDIKGRRERLMGLFVRPATSIDHPVVRPSAACCDCSVGFCGCVMSSGDQW